MTRRITPAGAARGLRIAGGLLTVLGLVFLTGGAWWGWSRSSWYAARPVAEGKVTGLEGSHVFYPVVTFSAPDGSVITFRSASGSKPAMYEIGEAVTVRFDPADPRVAEIDNWTERWLGPGIILLMGALNVVTGPLMAILFPRLLRPALGSSVETQA